MVGILSGEVIKRLIGVGNILVLLGMLQLVPNPATKSARLPTTKLIEDARTALGVAHTSAVRVQIVVHARDVAMGKHACQALRMSTRDIVLAVHHVAYCVRAAAVYTTNVF